MVALKKIPEFINITLDFISGFPKGIRLSLEAPEFSFRAIAHPGLN
jgi:hypothetical protein